MNSPTHSFPQVDPAPRLRLTAHFPGRRLTACSLWLIAAGAMAEEAPVSAAADGWADALSDRITALARDGARQGSAAQARVEVEVGSLDPRLKLAPCQRVEPYLPNGLPAWGHTRIGLRCTQGAKAWNVSLPVTVHVWSRSLVTTAALPAGTVLDASQLTEAEVDLGAAPGVAVAQLPLAIGRTLARTLPSGTALRQPDLKSRQWFTAGETVKLVAVGTGWRIVTEAQAVTPGVEGQPARVRTESGRLLQGRPVADREVEIAL